MKITFRPAILAALVAAATASPAFATGDGGDNGMTPWYGDSWTNVQSQQANAVEATAVPSLQAQEEKAPATEAWGHTRDNLRERTARVRESTSNALHRATGTPARAGDSLAPAASAPSTQAAPTAPVDAGAPDAATPRGH